MRPRHQECWQQLADGINARAGYHLLKVGFCAATQAHPRTAYRRMAIQRALLHEGLLSIFLSWEAVFHDAWRCWVWETPPSDDGAPINVIDNDIEELAEFPIIHKTPHGTITEVGCDTFCHPVFSVPLDPLVPAGFDVLGGLPDGSSLEGGVYMLPPDFGLQLHVNSIQFSNEP